MSLFKKKGKDEEVMSKNTEIKSILSDEELANLNPEGIEINTVIDDVTEQDTFNEDDIISMCEDGEVENRTEVEGE